MRKKIALFLILLYFLFLFTPFLNFFNIKAQENNNENNFNIENILNYLPGLNCGVAEDPNKNKCCNIIHPEVAIDNLSKFTNTTFAHFSSIPFLSPLFYFMFPITSLIKSLSILAKITQQNIRRNNLICQTGYPSTDDPSDVNCRCINPITPKPEYLNSLNEFCQNQSRVKERSLCFDCINNGKIWTGIGCVSVDFKGFIENTIFRLGIGLAGSFSLLCIIYAAFMMQSSQGNPEKLKKAQELITSCIMGLVVIIFSVFILKLIGVNILRVPGFN